MKSDCCLAEYDFYWDDEDSTMTNICRQCGFVCAVIHIN